MGELTPTTLAEALEARAAHPEAVPIAGGTDLMVAVNFGRLHPDSLLDLSGVSELSVWNGMFEKPESGKVPGTPRTTSFEAR